MKSRIVQNITSTLRGRLTLWYVMSVGLIIILFLLAVGGLFWITLQDQIDHHVHIAVNEAKQIVENYRGKERDDLIRNLVSARGMTVVVLSPDGSPILETNSPDIALVTEHQLQKILTASSLYDSTPTHFTENNIRFAAMPATVSAGKGIVAVGYSTQILYATLYNMLLVVLGVVFFVVLPITFFGYKLLEKQLKPLESIAVQAKAVTDTSSLAKRITIVSPTYELKIIQEALNAMLSQLENIFDSERQFFSDAAHTLKTPLAVLRSQTENANLGQKDREDMLKTIDKASDTIDDLLFLSRISSKPQRLETVSLTEIMTDLSELANTLGEEKKLTISADIQKDVTIKANKQLLLRALSNIVYNAVAYNQPQGSIKLSLKKEAHLIKINVQDTGIGISQHDLPQIFSRFYRGVNTQGKGSGLGLAISKAVIESLGGKIVVSSKQNHGTITTVTFS
jgi:signal transduction histidine kinase